MLTCFGKALGTFKLLYEYINFEIPNILRIQILPMGVRFLPFHDFSVFCIDSSLSWKFSLTFISALCEKCTPMAFIGFSGHKMSNNCVLQCFCLPSRNPSHLRIYSLRLETSPNISINGNATLADCMSYMKIVVSSAYWLSKIMLSLTLMLFISLFSSKHLLVILPQGRINSLTRGRLVLLLS